MILNIFIFIHIVISVLLVVVILMQSSKGGGLAGIMAGDSMGAMFGGRGASTFLTRATTILAILFVFTCMAQVFINKGRTGQQSVIQQELQETATPASSLPGLPVEPVVVAPPDTSN
ncbi:preprotein translocase subunit SecG [candidate division KSB1 bacterium]